MLLSQNRMVPFAVMTGEEDMGGEIHKSHLREPSGEMAEKAPPRDVQQIVPSSRTAGVESTRPPVSYFHFNLPSGVMAAQVLFTPT